MSSIQGYGSGGLLQASNNKLYGMSQGSLNDHDFGIIYEFNPATGEGTKIFSFTVLDQTGMPTSFRQNGALIQGNNGKLYRSSFIGNL